MFRVAVLAAILLVGLTHAEEDEFPFCKYKIQYYEKCLEKGFESTIGCPHSKMFMPKPDKMICAAVEGRIVKMCGYVCIQS